MVLVSNQYEEEESQEITTDIFKQDYFKNKFKEIVEKNKRGIEENSLIYEWPEKIFETFLKVINAEELTLNEYNVLAFLKEKDFFYEIILWIEKNENILKVQRWKITDFLGHQEENFIKNLVNSRAMYILKNPEEGKDISIKKIENFKSSDYELLYDEEFWWYVLLSKNGENISEFTFISANNVDETFEESLWKNLWDWHIMIEKENKDWSYTTKIYSIEEDKVIYSFEWSWFFDNENGGKIIIFEWNIKWQEKRENMSIYSLTRKAELYRDEKNSDDILREVFPDVWGEVVFITEHLWDKYPNCSISTTLWDVIKIFTWYIEETLQVWNNVYLLGTKIKWDFQKSDLFSLMSQQKSDFWFIDNLPIWKKMIGTMETQSLFLIRNTKEWLEVKEILSDIEDWEIKKIGDKSLSWAILSYRKNGKKVLQTLSPDINNIN